jgi:hypothetical protein
MARDREHHRGSKLESAPGALRAHATSTGPWSASTPIAGAGSNRRVLPAAPDGTDLATGRALGRRARANRDFTRRGPGRRAIPRACLCIRRFRSQWCSIR